MQGQSSAYAQKPGFSDTAYQSQKRETGTTQYQSYPLQGERYQTIQSQGSQILGSLQGSQVSGSQIGGLQGSQIRGSQAGGSQAGNMQTPRSEIKTFGV